MCISVHGMGILHICKGPDMVMTDGSFVTVHTVAEKYISLQKYLAFLTSARQCQSPGLNWSACNPDQLPTGNVWHSIKHQKPQHRHLTALFSCQNCPLTS